MPRHRRAALDAFANPAVALTLGLALGLASCVDTEGPTAAHAPAFAHAPGHCEVTTGADDGLGSLRALILDSDCETITFANDVETVLTSGQLSIERDVTIQGPGPAMLTVRGGGHRKFYVAAEKTVTLAGMRISGGHNWGSDPVFENQTGLGVLNRGHLTLRNVAVEGGIANWGGGIGSLGGSVILEDSEIYGNEARRDGAGMYAEATVVTIIRSHFRDNRVVNHGPEAKGGGLVILNGTATIRASTFSGNVAEVTDVHIPVFGGALYIESSEVLIENSTISGNRGIGSPVLISPIHPLGAGIHIASGDVTVRHTTVTDNSIDSALKHGAGINVAGGTLELQNSIVSGNQANFAPDLRIDGGALTASHTLVGHPVGHGVTHGEDGNRVGTSDEPLDALLGPLQDNGGPTWTHALLAGSPGIDAVPPGTNGCGTDVTTDQRGVFRPQGAACDMGAFEQEQAALFPFSGFFSPIENLPTVNVMKAGRAIPIGFSLSGDRGLDILWSGYPRSQPYACDEGVAEGEHQEGSTAGGSGLSYDSGADRYTYVWKTERSWAGSCRELTLKLSDGSERQLRFRFN